MHFSFTSSAKIKLQTYLLTNFLQIACSISLRKKKKSDDKSEGNILFLDIFCASMKNMPN